MRRIARAVLLAAAALAAPAHALTLERNDLVFLLESDNVLVRVNLNSGAAETLSGPAPGIVLRDIAFTSNGTLLGIANAAVYRINPATGGRTLFTAPGAIPGTPIAIVTSPDGRAFVVYGVGPSRGIARVDQVTGAVTPLANLVGVTSAYCFEPATNSILAASSFKIVRVNAVTGAQSLVSESPFIGNPPVDAAIAADGAILIAGVNGVKRIDPLTGEGAPFILPPPSGDPTVYGVAIESNGGVLLNSSGTYVLRHFSSGGPSSMLIYTAPEVEYFFGTLSVYNPTPCPADTNADHTVDFIDLNAVLSAFGQPCP